MKFSAKASWVQGNPHLKSYEKEEIPHNLTERKPFFTLSCRGDGIIPISESQFDLE